MATTAWKLPQSGALSSAWSSPANITAKDDAAASASAGAGQFSGLLIASNFGFSNLDFPVGATVEGIEVRLRLKKSGPMWVSTALYLRKQNGVNASSNKAASVTLTTNNLFSEPVAGGPTDLWNATWDDAEIKATSFQVVYQAANTDAKYSSNIFVDCIEARVHFTPPALAVRSRFALSMRMRP